MPGPEFCADGLALEAGCSVVWSALRGSGVLVFSPQSPNTLGLAPSLEPWCKDPAGDDGPEEPKVRQGNPGDQGLGVRGLGGAVQWDELIADRSAV